MKSRRVLALLLLSLITSSIMVVAVRFVNAYSTITVPDNYSSIQQAIDHAVDGDVILVRNGTYNESIIVNKRLSLIGMNGTQPVIDGRGASIVVKITADEVLLKGFKIINGGFGDSYGDGLLGGGIQLFFADNCVIANNTASNNQACGISLVNSNSNTLANNTCVKNWIGIRLWSSYPQSTSYNILDKNTCSENQQDGIHIWSYVYMTSTVNYNNITNNFISQNGIQPYYSDGIFIGKSIGDAVSGNTIFSNYYGINLDSSSQCKIFYNDFIGNNQQVHIWDEEGTSVNQWDNGYPSGGNYWSDYDGTDLKNGLNQNLAGSDGIGDAPQILNSTNQDRYPFMAERGTFRPSYTRVDFTNSFRDSKGASLYVMPSAFQVLYPNGTVSPLLAIEEYSIHAGTSKILNVIWQGSEVTPDAVTFDAAVGNPALNCKVYRLTVSPVFYDIADNQNETVLNVAQPINPLQNIVPSSWSIRFPNETIVSVSSPVTYAQTQAGSYSIQTVVLDGVELTSPGAGTLLTSDTVWSPRIGIFESANSQIFAFDSNSILTEPNFNASKKELSFTAIGPDGTNGYAQITFPRSLATKPEDIMVLQNGTLINCTVTQVNDAWLLSINYTHSAHRFIVDFSADTIVVPEFHQSTVLLLLLPLVTLIIAYQKRKKKAREFRRLELPATGTEQSHEQS